jgi:hypothetical protein
MRLSIATWNLERVGLGSYRRLPPIRKKIAEIAADCWVLTETRMQISPGNDYSPVHSMETPPNRQRAADERWVSVWSRWPISIVPTRESPWSATARVDTPSGPLIVQGVVLPYRSEPDPNGDPTRVWQEFSTELKLQAEDWAALRRQYPDIPLVLAGDFNQNLDGGRWYGNDVTRNLLRQAFHASGLVCLTQGDAIALGMLKDRRLVDHICVSPELAAGAEFSCWERVDSQKVRMSDHPGVVARLSDNRIR